MYFHLRFYMNLIIFYLGNEYFNHCEYLNHFATSVVILIKLCPCEYRVQLVQEEHLMYSIKNYVMRHLTRISLSCSFKYEVCVLFHCAVVISHCSFPPNNEISCFCELNCPTPQKK